MLPTMFHFIWLRGFQRRRLKCEKLTDDGRQVMAKAHICLWQGELKRTNNYLQIWHTIEVSHNEANLNEMLVCLNPTHWCWIWVGSYGN
jgi:hypothetical protein